MTTEEPMVVLSTGEPVMFAIVDAVARLLATGHVVSVVDGAVSIAPAVPSDTFDLLEPSPSDVAAVLADAAHLPIDAIRTLAPTMLRFALEAESCRYERTA